MMMMMMMICKEDKNQMIISTSCFPRNIFSSILT